jgi:hypothetical protein
LTSEEKLEELRQELVEYLKECYDFTNGDEIIDSIEIMKHLSGMSARASWVRNSIIRSKLPSYTRFRIDELDPFLDEVERQFKIWSRIVSTEQFEWDKSKG